MEAATLPRPADLLIHEKSDLCILEAPDGEGVFNPDGTVNMVLIRPCAGRGPYNNIYEAEMLAREAGKFTGYTMFDNHESPVARRARQGLPRPPSELAGVVRESWWDPTFTTPEDDKHGFDQGAVVGKCALTDAMEALVRKIPEAIKGSLNTQASNKRLSERNGHRGWIVEGFWEDTENSSFDLVTKAGAGGRVRSVLEALYDDPNATSGSGNGNGPEGGQDEMTDILEALRTNDDVKGEIVQMIAPTVTEAVTAGIEAALPAALEQRENNIREAVRDELGQADRLRRLASQARELIDGATLPQTAKTNLLAEYGIEESDSGEIKPGRALAVIEAVKDGDGNVTKPERDVLKDDVEEAIASYRNVIREAAPTVPRATSGGTHATASGSRFGGEGSGWADRVRARGLDPAQFGALKPEKATTE